MIKLTKSARGQALAKRLCRKIIQSGLADRLTAVFVPEKKAVRVGIPTKFGALDCAVDYPADTEHIQGVIAQLDSYRAHHPSKASGSRLKRAA